MIEILDAAKITDQFRLHPLGFFYHQQGIEKGHIRRIHIWLPNGQKTPDNDCHQHSFDIESRVLAGSMKSQIYQFIESQKGVELEFSVSYENEKSILNPTGRQGILKNIARFESVAGTSYNLAAGVIHRVEVIKKPCITLLNTFERNISIYTYGQKTETEFNRRLCTNEEAIELRRYLLSAVNSK